MRNVFALLAAIALVAAAGAARPAAFVSRLGEVTSWWAPAGRVCPTFASKASCEADTKKICTERHGTAEPACYR